MIEGGPGCQPHYRTVLASGCVLIIGSSKRPYTELRSIEAAYDQRVWED